MKDALTRGLFDIFILYDSPHWSLKAWFLHQLWTHSQYCWRLLKTIYSSAFSTIPPIWIKTHEDAKSCGMCHRQDVKVVVTQVIHSLQLRLVIWSTWFLLTIVSINLEAAFSCEAELMMTLMQTKINVVALGQSLSQRGKVQALWSRGHGFESCQVCVFSSLLRISL